MNFPSIYKACFAVTLDNGGLNRYRDVDQIQREYADFMSTYEVRYPGLDLAGIDRWYGSLSEDDMEIATAGEETEMQKLYEDAPQGAYALVEHWFEEHC